MAPKRALLYGSRSPSSKTHSESLSTQLRDLLVQLNDHLQVRIQHQAQLVLDLPADEAVWEKGCIEETHALADLLAARSIPHDRDIWGFDVNHDWPWWRQTSVLPPASGLRIVDNFVGALNAARGFRYFHSRRARKRPVRARSASCNALVTGEEPGTSNSNRRADRAGEVRL